MSKSVASVFPADCATDAAFAADFKRESGQHGFARRYRLPRHAFHQQGRGRLRIACSPSTPGKRARAGASCSQANMHGQSGIRLACSGARAAQVQHNRRKPARLQQQNRFAWMAWSNSCPRLARVQACSLPPGSRYYSAPTATAGGSRHWPSRLRIEGVTPQPSSPGPQPCHPAFYVQKNESAKLVRPEDCGPTTSLMAPPQFRLSSVSTRGNPRSLRFARMVRKRASAPPETGVRRALSDLDASKAWRRS